MQREDLNAYEKAAGIKALMEEYNMTQEEIANIIGISRQTYYSILQSEGTEDGGL